MNRPILITMFISLGVVTLLCMTLAAVNGCRSELRSKDDGATSEDFDRWEHKERVFGDLVCLTLCLMTAILPGIIIN